MKKIINIIMISMVLMCATACSSGTEKSETDAQSEAVIATPTPKPELPEKLHFMNGLDPVKNDDGTYSFKGYFAGYKYTAYSAYPRIYVRTENGHRVDLQGEDLAYRGIHNPNVRELGRVIDFLQYNPSSMNGLLFEFFFDANGTLQRLVLKDS